MNLKDITLSDNAPKQLLLDKHAAFIEAYGRKKDDYVSNIENLSLAMF